jgi:hypothetical protein
MWWLSRVQGVFDGLVDDAIDYYRLDEYQQTWQFSLERLSRICLFH